MTKKISQLSSAATLTGDEVLEVSQRSSAVQITATSISALASDNSFNDSANGFLAAGFAVGDQVSVSGFTGNVANNLFSATLTAVTAGKLTVGGSDGAAIVDDAAGESVTIFKWSSKRCAAQDIADLGGVGSASSAAYNNATAVQVFGDSVSVGDGASGPSTRWTAVFAAARGWTVNNNAVSGDAVADQANEVLATVVGAGTQSLYMVGLNDMRLYGSSVPLQGITYLGLMAALAHLSIPAGGKTAAQAATASGTWANYAGFGGALGRQSSTAASTLTFNLFGDVIYVWVLAQDGNTGTLNFNVDGVDYGTIANRPASGSIATGNGVTIAPVLIRIPTPTRGNHTVTITVVNATGTSVVLQAAGNLGHDTKDGPNVWAATIQRLGTYAGTVGSTALANLYSQIVKKAARRLSGDGLNVGTFEVAAALNDPSTLSGDNIHPNDTGHAAIAAAALSAVNQIGKPRIQDPLALSPFATDFTTSTSYVPNLSDTDHTVCFVSASPVTVNAPAHMACPFDLGDFIPFIGAGTGLVTFSNATIDVYGYPGLKIAGQAGFAGLLKRTLNSWALCGSLAA